jgi:hypothetical protein
MTDEQKAELLNSELACQSAYHIESTLGYRFREIGSRLQENQDGSVDYVESLRAERLAASAAPMQPTEARCKSCGGNDGDMPCAYPGEGKPGCLRDTRLAA